MGLLFVVTGYFFGGALLGSSSAKSLFPPHRYSPCCYWRPALNSPPLRYAPPLMPWAASQQVLRLSVLSAVIYLTLFTLLTFELGLIGAGVASCVAAIVPPFAMAILIRRGR